MTQTTDRPPVDIPGLTDEQRRGGACTYCGLPVWTRGAVDLGQRRDREGTLIFPRAHRNCIPKGTL